MKYLILACEGIVGAPVEELGGRTPLELAKTPNMTLLARKGQIGRASFIPHSLPVSPDVAVMSMLGFDPQEFYTGIAPLEAAAMGIPQDDTQIAFRCDLVTVLDNILVDTSASRISPKESRLLMEELNKKLSNDTIRFYPGEGHKNILLVSDPEKAEALDELECHPPSAIIGKAYDKYLPAGVAAPTLTGLMDRSREILENHEINRVRIDLGENPANMIWPWGQGKKPKMPGFAQRYGVRGSVVSSVDFVAGLGRFLGLPASDMESALKSEDLVFVYKSSEEPGGDGLKAKIKRIEEFDSKTVASAIKFSERFHDLKILIIAGDQEALILLSGPGAQSQDLPGFNEKTASQASLVFEEGHKLMGYFLGN